jgi:hypothetical protein
MNRTGNVRSTNVLLAAGLGALAMYLMDPQQGRRRVALARDKVVRLRRTTSDTAEVGLRDLTNRSTGLIARLRGALHVAPPDDAVLVERIRSKLGRWVSHPHAIQVRAASGCVTVDGQILEADEQRLVRGLRSLGGVRKVENRLEVHQTAGNIPTLQGGSSRPGPRPEFMQENWAPGPRLLTGAGGVALAWYGLGRRDPVGMLLGAAGVGLAACAVTNHQIGRTLGLSRNHRDALEIEKAFVETGVASRDAARGGAQPNGPAWHPHA